MRRSSKVHPESDARSRRQRCWNHFAPPMQRAAGPTCGSRAGAQKCFGRARQGRGEKASSQGPGRASGCGRLAKRRTTSWREQRRQKVERQDVEPRKRERPLKMWSRGREKGHCEAHGEPQGCGLLEGTPGRGEFRQRTALIMEPRAVGPGYCDAFIIRRAASSGCASVRKRGNHCQPLT